jgi:hypothetical protein
LTTTTHPPLNTVEDHRASWSCRGTCRGKSRLRPWMTRGTGRDRSDQHAPKQWTARLDCLLRHLRQSAFCQAEPPPRGDDFVGFGRSVVVGDRTRPMVIRVWGRVEVILDPWPPAGHTTRSCAENQLSGRGSWFTSAVGVVTAGRSPVPSSGRGHAGIRMPGISSRRRGAWWGAATARRVQSLSRRRHRSGSHAVTRTRALAVPDPGHPACSAGARHRMCPSRSP